MKFDQGYKKKVAFILNSSNLNMWTSLKGTAKYHMILEIRGS